MQSGLFHPWMLCLACFKKSGRAEGKIVAECFACFPGKGVLRTGLQQHPAFTASLASLLAFNQMLEEEVSVHCCDQSIVWNGWPGGTPGEVVGHLS